MNKDNILLFFSPFLRSSNSNSNSEEICGTLQAAEWTWKFNWLKWHLLLAVVANRHKTGLLLFIKNIKLHLINCCMPPYFLYNLSAGFTVFTFRVQAHGTAEQQQHLKSTQVKETHRRRFCSLKSACFGTLCLDHSRKEESCRERQSGTADDSWQTCPAGGGANDVMDVVLVWCKLTWRVPQKVRETNTAAVWASSMNAKQLPHWHTRWQLEAEAVNDRVGHNHCKLAASSCTFGCLLTSVAHCGNLLSSI